MTGTSASAESSFSVSTEAPAVTLSAPEGSVPSEAEAFLPADTVRALWDGFGLDRTAFETLREARERGDVIVTKGSDIAAGRDRLLAYLEATRRGEAGEVQILNYYDLTGIRCGTEYFEEEDANYPAAYLTRLSFDGEKYRFTVRRSDASEPDGEGEFRFLLHLEGKTFSPAEPFLYEHFVLADDDSLTWEQIEHGILSSQFGDQIPHHGVAYRLYREEALPEGSYVPDPEEAVLWYRLDGRETGNRHFAKANLDSERAVTLFAPQESSQNLLSFWEGGRILWRTELPYSISAGKPTAQGILLFGTEYSENASPLLHYLEHYDTEGRLLWQRKESANGTSRRLLAAGEKDGNTVCIFLTSESYQKYHAEVWTMDAEGNWVGRYEASLPAGTVRGACVSESGSPADVFLAVQENDPSGEAGGIYLISAGSAEAQRIAGFSSGMVQDGKTMVVEDILARDGFLYLSAYYCTEHEKKNGSVRDEAQDVIEWCFRRMEADASQGQAGSDPVSAFPDYSEEITPMIREKYTAVLFRAEVPEDGSLPGEFRSIWSRNGSLGGALGVNDLQEITWDIREIGPVIFSPATSFATLYGSCRVIRYFFGSWEIDAERLPDSTPGGYMLLDRTDMYCR